MVWKEYSETLKKLLALEASPVAVTYSMEPASNEKPGKNMACGALMDAALKGRIINLSKENSACGGGTTHLGLGLPHIPLSDADLKLKEFLTKGEKLFRSLAALHRMSLMPPPPTGLAKYVVFSPMEKAEFEPDVVVFVCNAEQGCRLITLATFSDGVPPKPNISGSLCYMTVTYSMVTGEVNLSPGDYTARRFQHCRPDQLFVSIPYHRMHNLMQSIETCSAGTAEGQLRPEE